MKLTVIIRPTNRKVIKTRGVSKMAMSKRFVRKLALIAVFASVLAMLVGGPATRQAHASAPPYQPDDLTAQGPFSPWFGSVTSDVVVNNPAPTPPTVIQNPANDDDTSANRAEVYTKIRENIAAVTNACVNGTDPTGGCLPRTDIHDWPTYLCDQIFQQIHAGNGSQSGTYGPFAYDETNLMTKAVACNNPADGAGTLTAARTNDQCIDFDFLVAPTFAQWEEKIVVHASARGLSFLGKKTFITHYLFSAFLQLDLRFELCNNGSLDASPGSTSAPISVNPYYNPDGVPGCVFPDGTKQCGVIVTQRNVIVSHNRTSGTVDWIEVKPGTSTEDLNIAHDFMFLPTSGEKKCPYDTDQVQDPPTCAIRTILDPSTFAGPINDINTQIVGGAQDLVTNYPGLHLDTAFTVVLSITNDLKYRVANGHVEQLPGVLNVELRQDHVAQLQVAGSSGCNGSNAASVDLVGLNFPPNATGTFGVHDATRSVPDVTGTFNTDSNGGFDTGSLPINAQTGDRIEAGAAVGSVGAYGALDPIQYCIG